MILFNNGRARGWNRYSNEKKYPIWYKWRRFALIRIRFRGLCYGLFGAEGFQLFHKNYYTFLFSMRECPRQPLFIWLWCCSSFGWLADGALAQILRSPAISNPKSASYISYIICIHWISVQSFQFGSWADFEFHSRDI